MFILPKYLLIFQEEHIYNNKPHHHNDRCKGITSLFSLPPYTNMAIRIYSQSYFDTTGDMFYEKII